MAVASAINSQLTSQISASGSVNALTQFRGSASFPSQGALESNSRSSSADPSGGAAAVATALNSTLSQLGLSGNSALGSPTTPVSGFASGNSGPLQTDSASFQQARQQFLQDLFAALQQTGVTGGAASASLHGVSGAQNSASTVANSLPGVPPSSAAGKTPGAGLGATDNGGAGTSNAVVANILALYGQAALGSFATPVTALAANPATNNLVVNPTAPATLGNGAVYTASGSFTGSNLLARLQRVIQGVTGSSPAGNFSQQGTVVESQPIQGSIGGAVGGAAGPSSAPPDDHQAAASSSRPANTGMVLTSSTGSSLGGNALPSPAGSSASSNPASPTIANLQRAFDRLTQASGGTGGQASLDGFLKRLSSNLGESTGTAGSGVSASA